MFLWDFLHEWEDVELCKTLIYLCRSGTMAATKPVLRWGHGLLCRFVFLSPPLKRLFILIHKSFIFIFIPYFFVQMMVRSV